MKECCKNCVFPYVRHGAREICCNHHPECDYTDHYYNTKNAYRSKCENFIAIGSTVCKICEYLDSCSNECYHKCNAKIVETEDRITIKRKYVKWTDACDNFKLNDIYQERLEKYGLLKEDAGV